jgi:RimJ/RimL family protein N-acetyltransferase
LTALRNASPVEIVPVSDPRTLDRFIRVAQDLSRTDPHYIPPLLSERRDALTPKGNPFFGHAEVALWIAHRDGQDVGRISAQRDHLVADKTIGHFGMLSAIDDTSVVAALLKTAEDWLSARGSTRVQGPFSLSINEETGLLVAGFDTPPMLMMPHDPPYLEALLLSSGYAGVCNLFAYITDSSTLLPPSATRMIARGVPAGVTLRMLRRPTLAADIAALVDIFNDGWSEHWGFVPITEDEVAHMAVAMRPLLHDRLVWFAEVDGAPVAFGLCLPNLNEAIRDLGGSLLPFGWAKLLWRLKVAGTRTARVPLMGMRKKFSGTLLGQLLPLHIMESLRREAAAMGIRKIEMSWILEDNKPMRHLAEAIGAEAYKTYRVYEKALTP